MAYVPLPAYDPGPGINFQPVNNALAQMTAQNNSNRQYGLQQQQVANQTRQTNASVSQADLANQQAIVSLSGGAAQMALASKDPGAVGQTWDLLKKSHPEFVSNLVAHGMDPNDAQGGLSFIANEARGYINPQDTALKAAQAADYQSQAGYRAGQLGLLKRQVDMGQKFINGGSQPQTPAAPQALTRTPDNKQWQIGSDGNYHEVDQ